MRNHLGPRIFLAVTVLLGSGSAGARAQDSLAVIAAKLESHYKKTAIDSNLNVINAGTVLVVQEDGILGIPPSSQLGCTATFKDGELHKPTGLSKAMCGNDVRPIAIGEKVYLLGIDVQGSKDKVTFQVIECDSCNGFSQASSYKAFLVFQFPPGYLKSCTEDQVEDVIDHILAADLPPAQPQEASAPPAQTPAAPGLTNDDVIKLAQEKLPDAIIVAKIKTSMCSFDTTPDGLIKLKRSGVSNAVLQAMVEAPVATAEAAPSEPAPASGDTSVPAISCPSYDACMKMAQSMFGASLWDRSAAAFQQASQLDPSKPEAYAGIGNAYLQLAQYDDAAATWDKVLQLGASLSFDTYRGSIIAADPGQFFISTKEVSFVNKKGQKEFSAAPSAVTSQGAVVTHLNDAYFLQIRADKEWHFFFIPKNLSCKVAVCPEPGLTQQKVVADYLHGALVRIVAGDLTVGPPSPASPSPPPANPPANTGGAPAGAGSAADLAKRAGELYYKKQYQDALSLSQRACTSASQDGCAIEGFIYAFGFGVQADPARGGDLMQKSCAAGSSIGCDVLGLAYSRGISVPNDPGKAAELFTSSCNGGFYDGCANLAMCYAVGVGVQRDAAQAQGNFDRACTLGHEQLTEACDGGYPDSCRKLARCYVRGVGVQRDPAKARELMTRALQNGRPDGL
jgi:tetratricopeptide (TPR) repeat protein